MFAVLGGIFFGLFAAGAFTPPVPALMQQGSFGLRHVNAMEETPSVQDQQLQPPDSEKNLDINDGQQGKHVRGHNNFDEAARRSELTDPDPQKLIDEHAGTGEQVGKLPVGEVGSKERIDFGKIIGDYINKETNEQFPTTKGLIHYGSKGVHIVPARP